jgi:hypothetical protein
LFLGLLKDGRCLGDTHFSWPLVGRAAEGWVNEIKLANGRKIPSQKVPRKEKERSELIGGWAKERRQPRARSTEEIN